MNKSIGRVSCFALLAVAACQQAPQRSPGAPVEGLGNAIEPMGNATVPAAPLPAPSAPSTNPILGLWAGHNSDGKYGWKFETDWFADCCVGGEDRWQGTYRINGNRIEARPASGSDIYIFELQSNGTLKIIEPGDWNLVLHRCSEPSLEACVAAEPLE